ncbi:MAG TPA: energy transducer TonB [Bryobacteraceae bacterium]|nr:energy transducer TonB [Bryobacteraceae bacterium]
MKAAAIFLAVLAASAQTGEDARPLLRSIMNAAASAGSVRAEGVIARETADPAIPRRETRFKLVTQGPQLMRYQAGSGAGQVLQVCDGVSRWDYSEASRSYTRATQAGEKCAPPAAWWSGLMEGLASATVTGPDHSEFEGRMQPCEVIEAAYASFRRRLCVDPARGLVLRERTDYPAAAGIPGAAERSTTITYSQIVYGPAQAAEAFQFQPPAGSSQGGFNLPLMGEGGAGSYAGLGFSPPRVISKAEPQYSPEARQARLQGSVVVRLIVDEEGVPGDMQVVHSLGMGLDEKALEAVSAWRFRPGTRGGRPVAAPMQVVVNFRIP